MLRRVFAVLIVLGFSVPAFSQNEGGPAKAKGSSPEISFESVPNFFKLPPGLYMTVSFIRCGRAS